MKLCFRCPTEISQGYMCKPCRSEYNKEYRADHRNGPVKKGDYIFAYDRTTGHVHYEMDGLDHDAGVKTAGCICTMSGKTYTTTEDLKLKHDAWLVTTTNYGEFCPKEALCAK